MSQFTTEKELISLERKSILGKAKLKQKMLVSSTLLIAGILIAGIVGADISNSNLPEAEESITVQQQQKLIDWNMKAHAALSKRLDAKLHQELTSMLHSSDGKLDIQVPGIDLPTQQLLCAGESASVPSHDTRISLGACYAGIPK